MPHPVPPELSTLLDSPEGSRRDDAWATFLERHSRLLLHVARSFSGERLASGIGGPRGPRRGR